MTAPPKKKSEILPLGKLRIGLLKDIFQEYKNTEIMENLEKFEKLGLHNSYENSKDRVKMGFATGRSGCRRGWASPGASALDVVLAEGCRGSSNPRIMRAHPRSLAVGTNGSRVRGSRRPK